MNKKYFSKALFYADRSHYFSILLITSLYMLLCSFTFLIDGPNAIPQLLDVTALSAPILVINMIIIFFSYTGKRSKQFYMTTQPYSRDAMVLTKLIGFSLSYIIPVFIYGVIVSLLYLTGTKGISDVLSAAVSSPLLVLWKNIGFTSIGFISMTIGLQFIQTLFGKCRYAFLIPFVFSLFIIPITITLIFLYVMGINPHIGDYLVGIAKNFAGWLISLGNSMLANLLWTFLGDLIHIAVFTPLTLFLNRRIKSEKTDDMFTFKPVEIICKVLLSVFIGFCAVSVIAGILLIIAAKISSSSIDINISDSLASILCTVMIVAGAALSVLSYKIANKIQARRA